MNLRWKRLRRAVVGLAIGGSFVSIAPSQAEADTSRLTPILVQSELALNEISTDTSDKVSVGGSAISFEPGTAGLGVVSIGRDGPELIARLSVGGVSTRLWTGYGCVTGSERYAAAVFAPIEIGNDPALADRSAFLAVVDLVDRSVVLVEDLVALKYHSPGCGPGNEVAAVKYVADGAQTEVLSINAATGEIDSQMVDGRLAFPAPVDDEVYLSAGGRVVRASDGDSEVTVEGEVVDLHVNADGGLDFLQIGEGSQLEARTALEGTVETIARGELGELRWAPGRNGRNAVRTVGNVSSSVPTVKVDALDEVVSSRGEVVGEIRAAETDELDVSDTIEGDAVAEGGLVLEKPDGDVDPVAGTVLEKPAKSVVLTVDHLATASVVPNQQMCAVPVNDPDVQVVQPSPEQVEWAAHVIVRGELQEARPADWNNNGLGAYSPQAEFGFETLDGGGRIPAQVLLGVLGQESNLWQASRGALPGVAANPLVGNYFGADFEGGRVVSVDPSKADCGYGVGQVTDGMRLGIYDPYTASQQKVIATDYLANMVAAHNILASKWNELRTAGLITPDMSPEAAENWYFALWAYNTGYHDGSESGGRAGLGWTNNPANSNYRFDRRYFLRASLDDASRPQDWPYQERVLGFVENGLRLYGVPAFDPAHGVLDLPVVEGTGSTAWRSHVDRFVLCTAHNECDRDHAHPGGAPVEGDSSFCTRHPDRECFWNQAAPFLPPAGSGVTENINAWLTAGSSVPVVLNPYPPACTADDSTAPPFGVVPSFPANTIVIDDVPPGTDNVAGCSNVKASGRFELDFGSNFASVDFGQLGTGYGGHFWYSHTNWPSRPAHTITGTWTPPTGTTGWHRILVHIPTVGADTYQADYRIYDGTESVGNPSNFHRVVNQRWNRNQWIDLGFFDLHGGARIELSNETYSDHGQTVTATGEADEYYEDGKLVNIAWDAVALIPSDEPFVSHVAFGDSYSSGEGDRGGILSPGSYLANTDIRETSSNETNACHRSTRAYGPLAFAGLATDMSRSTFATVACSGALLVNVDGRATHWGEVPQLRSGWIDANATHVTIGIGGNDAGFSEILKTCLTPLNDCLDNPLEPGELPVRLQVGVDIESLRPRYNALVAQVRDAANENTRIVLVGYPHVIVTGYAPQLVCETLESEERTWMAEQVDHLNMVLSEVAAAHDGVFFAQIAPAYTGHEACALDEWINSVSPDWCGACNDLGVATAGSFHPNEDGHAAAAPIVLDILSG